MTMIKRAIKFFCEKCQKEIINAKQEEKDGKVIFTCPVCGEKLNP